MILEIAAFSEKDAIKAVNAGADRIELCENYAVGGITCSKEVLMNVRSKIHVPVFTIIRPREGDFVYTDTEFEEIKKDINLCKKLKYDGIVTGILQENGNVDVEKMIQIVAVAKPLPVTFHRAFDETQNPFKALEQIIDCGCKRILTSGQMPSALEGKNLIKQLIEKALNKITIIPGGGVRSKNIKEIWQYTAAIEFHSAARTFDVFDTVNCNEVKQLKFWQNDK